jgi:hypothetical protein
MTEVKETFIIEVKEINGEEVVSLSKQDGPRKKDRTWVASYYGEPPGLMSSTSELELKLRAEEVLQTLSRAL